MNIFLIGFMGSGKTTIGKKLAKSLQLKFIDMDKLLEKKNNKTIGDIFQIEGEEEFRKKEHSLLKELCRENGYVLSTGGGVPCYHNNMELINKYGKSVYLRMTPNALFSRLKNVREVRPLIKNFNDIQLLKYIEEKLKEREPFYLKAHISIEALDLNINELISKIKNS